MVPFPGCPDQVDVQGSRGYVTASTTVNVSSRSANTLVPAQDYDGHTVLGSCQMLDLDPQDVVFTVVFRQDNSTTGYIFAINDATSDSFTLAVRSGNSLSLEFTHTSGSFRSIALAGNANDGELHVLHLVASEDNYAVFFDGEDVRSRSRNLPVRECKDCKVFIGGYSGDRKSVV